MLKQNTLRIFLLVCAFFLLACQSTKTSRQPNSTLFEFNTSKVQLLKWAAQNRIMFQFPDSTFHDVSYIQAQESCKILKEPVWSEAVFSTLEKLRSNVSLQNKIHIIEVKRGDYPKAEITKDLDGITYLILSYSILEAETIANSFSQIPCEKRSMPLESQKLLTVTFNLPKSSLVAQAIQDLPIRSNPERWNFKTDFIKYLAEKQTILRFSSDLGFEKSAEGKFFFTQFLNEQAEFIRKNKFTYFEYWMNEITQRSHAGSYLKVMALLPSKSLNYGMSTLENSHGLPFPFLGYKSQDGKYTYTSMNQLNDCLQELSSRYKRGLASIRTEFSTQADSFLHPGHICRTKNP